jgi:hypothetical protein
LEAQVETERFGVFNEEAANLFDVKGQNGFYQNHAPAVSNQFMGTTIIVSNIVFAAVHKIADSIADSKGLLLPKRPQGGSPEA